MKNHIIKIIVMLSSFSVSSAFASYSKTNRNAYSYQQSREDEGWSFKRMMTRSLLGATAGFLGGAAVIGSGHWDPTKSDNKAKKSLDVARKNLAKRIDENLAGELAGMNLKPEDLRSLDQRSPAGQRYTQERARLVKEEVEAVKLNNWYGGDRTYNMNLEQIDLKRKELSEMDDDDRRHYARLGVAAIGFTIPIIYDVTKYLVLPTVKEKVYDVIDFFKGVAPAHSDDDTLIAPTPRL